jgi:large subunit ribosomal protein L3
MSGLIGRKLGMTQVFDDEGRALPVTVVEAGPCPIVQLRTQERDGYAAVQLGFQEKKKSRVRKPEAGHFARAGVAVQRHLREFPVPEGAALQVGEEVKVGIFSPGEKVSVTGRSKGRGFAGVFKRHGMHGGNETHGCMSHRVPGSLGAASYPARVFKGRKLPGHMGNVRVTVRNLEVVGVDSERNVLLIRGAVPGPRNGIVTIRKK